VRGELGGGNEMGVSLLSARNNHPQLADESEPICNFAVCVRIL